MSPLDAFVVAAGGALGALIRACVGRLVRNSGAFPLATFMVNLVGSFILVAGYALIPEGEGLARLFLGAGFCGALTTFSTFALETSVLFKEGKRLQAWLYLILTPLLCCLASLLAIRLFT